MADAAVKLVVMRRGEGHRPPHVVDVHPNEIDNYRVGGFEIDPVPVIAATEAEKPKQKRKAKNADS